MLDKITKALQDVSEQIRQQTAHLGEGAKERTYQLIDEWLQIFPKLEIYGLKINSLSLGVSLNPVLEVELLGKHDDFKPERVDAILQENRKNAAITTVFTTIKTTYTFHRRTLADLREPLIVKIRVRLSPEVRVFIGEPLIQ